MNYAILRVCSSQFFVTSPTQKSTKFDNRLNPSANYLRKWLQKSNYFTRKPMLACLNVQIVETKEFMENSIKMPNEGQNQLFIFTGHILPPARNNWNYRAIFVAPQFLDG